MPTYKSRLAQVGNEARMASNREQIRTAMRAALGNREQAAEALGILPTALSQYARDCGLDWEALVAECVLLDRGSDHRDTGT